MEPPCFDENYVAGLRDRDAAAEEHFVAHFKLPIRLKARRQLRSPDLVEDACQETVLRVLQYFRAGKRLDHPERLPAFVYSVCHNVTLEIIRSKMRYMQMAEDAPEPPDNRIDLFRQLEVKERKQLVRDILGELSEKDRELLRLASLEELDKAELCERFDVQEDYLRVLLHRARMRFRDALLRSKSKEKRKKAGLG